MTGIFDEIIVLLETKLANPKKEVFVLQFAIGEFNMVIFDPAAGSCEICEIKHSTEAVAQQYRHLIDVQKGRLAIGPACLYCCVVA